MNILAVTIPLAIVTVLLLEILYLRYWKKAWASRDILLFSQKSGTYARVIGGSIAGLTVATTSTYPMMSVPFAATTWLSMTVIETDLRSRKIPKEPCWFVFAIGTIAGLFSYSLYGLISALAAFVVLGGLLLLLALLTKGGLGSGDLRLVVAFTPLAWWVGVLPMLYGLFFASLLQGIIHLTLMVLGKNKTHLPFGPALVLGLTVVSVLAASGLVFAELPIFL